MRGIQDGVFLQKLILAQPYFARSHTYENVLDLCFFSQDIGVDLVILCDEIGARYFCKDSNYMKNSCF